MKFIPKPKGLITHTIWCCGHVALNGSSWVTYAVSDRSIEDARKSHSEQLEKLNIHPNQLGRYEEVEAWAYGK